MNLNLKLKLFKDTADIRSIRFLMTAIVITLLFCGGCDDTSSIHISSIQCNDKVAPVGIKPDNLSFSWQMASSKRNQRQSGWQVVVGRSQEALKSCNYMWNSGRHNGQENLHVPYQGPSLKPARRYYWRVKVWDRKGMPTGWSRIGSFVTGLFNKDDWQGAEWIGYETLPDSMRVLPGVHGNGNDLGLKGKRRSVIPYFRHKFKVDKPVKEAFLFISGMGQYEASLNGQKIGDRFLSPGWTDYRKTVLYNTYDVTKQLTRGNNALGVVLGNGFYNINRERYRKLVIAYGMPKMICQLRLTYKDGSTAVITSGPDWKTTPSPITYTSIYGGEDYNACKEQVGWNKSGFNDQGWKSALTVEPPQGVLRAQQSYPLTVADTMQVKHIIQLKTSVYMYDFGQNVSGIVKLKVKGKKGQQVKLTPAELINDEGMANQNATGKPYYYTYTLKGDGVETWQPKFSYYGFRYVQVEGAHPDTVSDGSRSAQLVDLMMLHTRNSTPRSGHFKTSFKLFNRIYDLINWAIKSNLQHVVTDCPHREKLGWMEQTHLMGGSIHYNYGLYHLYKKMIHDMMDAQTSEGLVPDIAPEYVKFAGGFRDSPEWGSASVILPWMLYKWYGDTKTLREAWPMMTRYVNYLKGKSNGHILSYGLGDWYDLGPDFPGPAQLTPKALTATAIYYYDVKLLSRIAKLVNKSDSAKYSGLTEQIKRAFNARFLNEKTDVYSTGSQTAMAMPLVVGLVKRADRQHVFSNLTDSIRANNKALTAGDIGFHFLVKALQDGGANQLLYEMNARDDVPGYGYQLKKGATSLTESWAALKEVSNNHLMLGHIMQWFYEGLAGIKQADDSKGYDHIIFEPNFVGDIWWVKADYASPHGQVASEWHINGQEVSLAVEVPVNAIGTVVIPSGQINRITESGHPIENHSDFKVTRKDSNQTSIRIGSGKYHFEFRK